MEIGSTASGGFQCSSSTPGGAFPVPPLSAFHFLRNYNYLLAPRSPVPDFITKQILPARLELSNLDDIHAGESHKLIPAPSLFGYPPYNPILPQERLISVPKSNVISTCSAILSQSYRKTRGQKKAIPDEQKDDKYFERRRRNNQAAKKSRDARKQREDHVALRATILEHENALLKAQVITLREEASSLRQLLLEKKTLEFQQTNLNLSN